MSDRVHRDSTINPNITMVVYKDGSGGHYCGVDRVPTSLVNLTDRETADQIAKEWCQMYHEITGKTW